jgi:hypothetical protein
LPRPHRDEDQNQQRHANAEGQEPHRVHDALPLRPFVLNADFFKLLRGQHPVVPPLALVEHLRLGHASRKDHWIHREFLQPEMHVEEVEGKDEARREQRFIAVHDQRHIDHPPRQEAREKGREPHDQPRRANDANAPKNRHVVKFLPVGPAVELRLRAPPQEPFLVRPPVLQVG